MDKETTGLKGKVSRDFRCMQMILKDSVPGIPLDVNFF